MKLSNVNMPFTKSKNSKDNNDDHYEKNVYVFQKYFLITLNDLKKYFQKC